MTAAASERALCDNSCVESLPLVFSSGWTAGINAYATVLMMGLLGRFGGVESVPEGLQSDAVLIGAALMFTLEFVADKVPYVDSAWDAVHTAVRPTIGAIIGLLVAGESQDLGDAAGVSIGGGTALLSHAVKAGIRLLVNLSPEPFSNIVLSLAEDATVAGMVSLTLAAPWLAALIALTLLLLGLLALTFALRTARRLWRRRMART
jgi:hypothetical protein